MLFCLPVVTVFGLTGTESSTQPAPSDQSSASLNSTPLQAATPEERSRYKVAMVRALYVADGSETIETSSLTPEQIRASNKTYYHKLGKQWEAAIQEQQAQITPSRDLQYRLQQARLEGLELADAPEDRIWADIEFKVLNRDLILEQESLERAESAHARQLRSVSQGIAPTQPHVLTAFETFSHSLKNLTPEMRIKARRSHEN